MVVILLIHTAVSIARVQSSPLKVGREQLQWLCRQWLPWMWCQMMSSLMGWLGQQNIGCAHVKEIVVKRYFRSFFPPKQLILNNQLDCHCNRLIKMVKLLIRSVSEVTHLIKSKLPSCIWIDFSLVVLSSVVWNSWDDDYSVSLVDECLIVGVGLGSAATDCGCWHRSASSGINQSLDLDGIL